MRLIIGFTALLLPACTLTLAAFAQSAMGPTVPIPVHRCVREATTVTCGPVQDGAGFAAADGYTRAWWSNAAVAQRATASQATAGSTFTR